MPRHRNARAVLIPLAIGLIAGIACAQKKSEAVREFRLDSLTGLEMVNAKAEVADYRGRRAVHLIPLSGGEARDEMMMAILDGTDFSDGVIEAEIAGAPRSDAPADARGFIGVLFRVQSHGARAENFYIRPTNGRSDDQLRRNHSVQYESAPDFPWHRLRQESPGVYESYADLQAGAWTRMKIEVSGSTARLYINGGTQPALIVNDLKNGIARGQIGFWCQTTTEGYFANLKVTPLRAEAGKTSAPASGGGQVK